MVVPADPPSDCAASLLEVVGVVLPEALLFETSEEAFNQAVLLGRIWGDEFLAKPVEATGCLEATALKDETVVATDHRSGTLDAQSAKAPQTSSLKRSFRLLSPSPKRQLLANDLSVVTVDHSDQMRPTVLAACNVRDVHGPA